MQVTHCKKCGRVLRDPESVARGMGPECAGIAGRRQKKYSFRRHIPRGSVYLQEKGGTPSPTLFSLVGKEEQAEEKIPTGEEQTLRRGQANPFGRFPSDLVAMVLSVSAPGRVTSSIQMYSRRTTRKSERINQVKALQEIRRTCLESRLAFWPGILKNGQPVACVPYIAHFGPILYVETLLGLACDFCNFPKLVSSCRSKQFLA